MKFIFGRSGHEYVTAVQTNTTFVTLLNFLQHHFLIITSTQYSRGNISKLIDGLRGVLDSPEYFRVLSKIQVCI